MYIYIYLIYNVQVLQLKSITCRKNKFSNILMDTYMYVIMVLYTIVLKFFFQNIQYQIKKNKCFQYYLIKTKIQTMMN